MMSRVYVGNLQPYIAEKDLETVFQVFGVLRSVWVSRRRPAYAFVEFDDRRDALEAIEELDGRNGWHVELSHNSRSGRGSRCSSEDISCSECGQSDHVARDCCLHGSGGLESGRHYRSSSDQYHQSPSYRYRSFSPLRRSPRGIRDTTYRHGYRGQSYTRSPIYHGNNPHDSNGCN
ncbi:serine/arginine-rich splicing factor RSZ21A isoform X1 [Dendrobium catenatum]|uniref:serine/arginine-rich splicing factor RSZ21A isoform X1 n=1 Tax=Dendrobium catenatum TaxID=906689 RepID=UPI0009F45D52|nr:serine/arginine-rich splicing factor RSZ21A isoform X1 [Dendrobium catenatum]